MSKLRHRVLFGIGRLSLIVFNALRPVLGARLAVTLALFFQFFATSPMAVIKVLLFRKRAVVMLLEGDRRFELLAKKDIAGRVNFWLTKNILDKLAIECFTSWFNEFAGDSNHRYVDPLERYYHPKNQKNRQSYKSYTDKVASLFSTMRVDAVLFASADDTINFELIRSVNDASIKAVLFEREGTHTINTAHGLEQMYLNTSLLTFDAIFCANDVHAKCYKNSSKLEMISGVVGELRSDLWHLKRFDYSHPFYKRIKSFRKVVVLLAFGERNYIEPYFCPELKGDWKALSQSLDDALIEFIRKRPDICFVYKIGHMEDHNAQAIERYSNACPENFFSFDRVFDCSTLLSRSDVVIGFQSTATIEALCYATEVIYPFWDLPKEIDTDAMMLPFHKHPQVFHIATSRSEFSEHLSNLVDKSTVRPKRESISAARMAVINAYFGKFDGKVADRAASSVAKLLV